MLWALSVLFINYKIFQFLFSCLWFPVPFFLNGTRRTVFFQERCVSEFTFILAVLLSWSWCLINAKSGLDLHIFESLLMAAKLKVGQHLESISNLMRISFTFPLGNMLPKPRYLQSSKPWILWRKMGGEVGVYVQSCNLDQPFNYFQQVSANLC